MGMIKYLESEKIKIISSKKGSVIRNLIKSGKLKKKDWTEEKGEEENE